MEYVRHYDTSPRIGKIILVCVPDAQGTATMGSAAGGGQGGGGRPPDFGGKFFNTFRPPRFWRVL